MSHYEQRLFCQKISRQFSNWFKNKRVLDAGSLHVNGNNRYLFKDCDYTGIDLVEGLNVDIVSKIHEFKAEPFDTIISTEVFEHDQWFEESLLNIVKLLKPLGLFLMTCAGPAREEHGTKGSRSEDSLGTLDFYKNRTELDFQFIIKYFSRYQFSTERSDRDLYFWGIKK